MKKYQIGFLGIGFTKQYIVKCKDWNAVSIVAANKLMTISKKVYITTVLIEELKD